MNEMFTAATEIGGSATCGSTLQPCWPSALSSSSQTLRRRRQRRTTPASAPPRSATPAWSARTTSKTHLAARCKTHRWLRFGSRLTERSSLMQREYSGPPHGTQHYNRRLFIHLPAPRKHHHRTALRYSATMCLCHSCCRHDSLARLLGPRSRSCFALLRIARQGSRLLLQS